MEEGPAPSSPQSRKDFQRLRVGRFFFVLPPPLKPEQQKVFGNVNDTFQL